MSIGVAFRDSDIPKFLASEPTWTQRLGDGWKGVKFLGKGSFGVVGLWRYEGEEGPNAPEVREVVVKQSNLYLNHNVEPLFGMTGLDEGQMLEKLSKTGSQHIIRQYGGFHTGDRFGDMDQVVKLFLEYCPGGDVDQLLAGVDRNGNQLPRKPPIGEADLWALFTCMALGVVVMHRGTEVTSEPAWGGQYLLQRVETEICHFDIKPDNLLFGYRNPEHDRVPIVKIADFGEAAHVELSGRQTDEYGGQFSNRGNANTSPPEETVNTPAKFHPWKGVPVDHPRKGTCSNIWQIGCVMNMLLLGRSLHFNVEGVTLVHSNLTPQLQLGATHSIELDTAPVSDLYSATLRALVMECLLREPLQRPVSIDLVARCQAGLAAALTQQRSNPAVASPEALAHIPTVGLRPPEPPHSWIYDPLVNEWNEDDEFNATSGLPRGARSLPSSPTSPGLATRLSGLVSQLSSTSLSSLTPPSTPPRMRGLLRSVYPRNMPLLPSLPSLPSAPRLIGLMRAPPSRTAFDPTLGSSLNPNPRAPPTPPKTPRP